MTTHRQNFMLTTRDRSRLARIKEAHGLRTDTDALRHALELAADDSEFDGIGAAALDAAKAYRNVRELQAQVSADADSEGITAGLDLMAHNLTPDMPAWWAQRHDEQREREAHSAAQG